MLCSKALEALEKYELNEMGEMRGFICFSFLLCSIIFINLSSLIFHLIHFYQPTKTPKTKNTQFLQKLIFLNNKKGWWLIMNHCQVLFLD